MFQRFRNFIQMSYHGRRKGISLLRRFIGDENVRNAIERLRIQCERLDALIDESVLVAMIEHFGFSGAAILQHFPLAKRLKNELRVEYGYMELSINWQFSKAFNLKPSGNALILSPPRETQCSRGCLMGKN
jgi:hypothetical protein